MKKLEAILKGKQGCMSSIKEKKIYKSIEVALLNAEDDIQTKMLEYENAMGMFANGLSDYSAILDHLVAIKKDILDIQQWVVALRQVQADLEADVEVEK